jgi:hypothetical protein
MSKSPLGTPGVNTEISATVMLAVKQGASTGSSDLRAVEGGA